MPQPVRFPAFENTGGNFQYVVNDTPYIPKKHKRKPRRFGNNAQKYGFLFHPNTFCFAGRGSNLPDHFAVRLHPAAGFLHRIQNVVKAGLPRLHGHFLGNESHRGIPCAANQAIYGFPILAGENCAQIARSYYRGKSASKSSAKALCGVA